MRACWPTITFSIAVIDANRRMFWNVRATPSFVMMSGRVPVTSWPSNSIVPERRLVEPVSMLKNVVLPAPLGPMIETIERGGTVEGDVLDGHQAAERLRHVVGREQASAVRVLTLRGLVAARGDARVGLLELLVDAVPRSARACAAVRGSGPRVCSTIINSSRKPNTPKETSVNWKLSPSESSLPCTNVPSSTSGISQRVDEAQRHGAEHHSPDRSRARRG